MNQFLIERCLINGEWQSALSSATFTVTNPATGEELAQVPDMGRTETQLAISAASSALPSWKTATAKARSEVLMRWYQLIMEHQQELAELLTAEQGKPLAEAMGEVAYGASYIQWFAEEAKRIYGDIIPAPQANKRVLVTKEPVGVVAAITPWNFPNAMVTRKCATALAAGCTIIVKPAESTPLSALALAKLAEQAGLPAGVMNIVTAANPKDVGDELTGNPLVRKLSFTGSTGVGKLLMRQCTSNLKKMSLELGGNAPFIVFEDADLEAAAEGLMQAKFRNSGQTCICANRVLVHENVRERFTEILIARVKALKTGPGNDSTSTQGPLINQAAISKVEGIVADAVAKGAHVQIGGERLATDSLFYQPTILSDVTEQMLCYQDEIFGPVAPLISFSSEADAIRIANDTPYGLAAYFYSQDIARIWRVSDALEYGMVGINEGVISSEAAPFGGIKESGFGREGSKYGIEDFIELKYLCLGGLS